MSSSRYKKITINSKDFRQHSANDNNADKMCDKTESETAMSVASRFVDNGQWNEDSDKLTTITLNIILGSGNSPKQQEINEDCRNVDQGMGPSQCNAAHGIIEVPINECDTPSNNPLSNLCDGNNVLSDPCNAQEDYCAAQMGPYNSPMDPCINRKNPHDTPNNSTFAPQIKCNKPNCHSTSLKQSQNKCEASQDRFDALPETCNNPNCPYLSNQESPNAPMNSRNASMNPQNLCSIPQKQSSPPQNQRNMPQNLCNTQNNPCSAPVNLYNKSQNPCITPQSSCSKPQNPCNMPQNPCNTQNNPTYIPQNTSQNPCNTPQSPCNIPQNPCNTQTNPVCAPQNASQNPCNTPQSPCYKSQSSCNVPQNPCNAQNKPVCAPQNASQNPCNTPQSMCNKSQNTFSLTQNPCAESQNRSIKPESQCNAPQNQFNSPQNCDNKPQSPYNMSQNPSCTPQSQYNASKKSFNKSQSVSNDPQQSCNTPQDSSRKSSSVYRDYLNTNIEPFKPQSFHDDAAAFSMATPCVCQKDNNHGRKRTDRSFSACGRKERNPGIDFDIIDQNIEIKETEEKTKKNNSPSIYLRSQGISSKYSRLINDDNETPEERSFKITVEARVDIEKIKAVMIDLFNMLSQESELMLIYDFSLCGAILGCIQDIQTALDNMMDNLRYSPYLTEMALISDRLYALIDELKSQPPFVLLRLVEFGWNVYEIGVRVRVELLPPTFAVLIHKIQNRIYRLSSGKVVRQIYFVPINFDPIVGTYYKSRRLIRLEQFCHCHIVLLPPTDPRHTYCPNNYRTIEVNFDYECGRHLGFENLLNQCAISGNYKVRLAATILRRLSGADLELSPTGMYEIELTTPRVAFMDMKSNLTMGSGLAWAPKVNTIG